MDRDIDCEWAENVNIASERIHAWARFKRPCPSATGRPLVGTNYLVLLGGDESIDGPPSAKRPRFCFATDHLT